ncbi:MAG: PepSY domain-containing protein [Hyphomicrobiaceae bacterium]
MYRLMAKRALLGLALVIVFAGPGPSAVSAKEMCFTDWAEAAVAVKKHKLISVDRLGIMAKRRSNAKLIKIELCRKADSFFYNLVLRGPRGKLRRLKIDAKRPIAAGAMLRW